MSFLYWLYLTPSGLTAFGTFLVLTVLLSIAEDRRRASPVRRAPTFDDKLALLRRELRVPPDIRNN